MNKEQILAQLKPVNKTKLEESAVGYNKSVRERRIQFRAYSQASELFVAKAKITR